MQDPANLTSPPDPTRPRPTPRPTEQLARSRPAGLVLLALLLAVYLPGFFSIPVVDRDEARFAQASRQMFESLALPAARRDTRPFERTDAGQLTAGHHAGGLAVPMVGDRPRLAKPPLIYWLQSASAAILTAGDPLADRVWHYRVPSLLSAVAACFITWRLGVAMGRARAGWLAAALLGVCPMVVWDAHQARADQLLFALTTATMAALFAVRLRSINRPTDRAWLAPICFWAALALGILTKGPITPMVAAGAVVTISWISRDWRWFRHARPLVGLAIVAALLAPWLVASANAVGAGTLARIWLDETLGRSASPKEGHWGPPGYHFVLLALLFWPGSLLTLHALSRAVRRSVALPAPTEQAATRRARWKARAVADHHALFLIAWIVPAWLVFEIVGTKLPHYTLPLYPAVALVTAIAVVELADLIDRAAAPSKPLPPLGGLLIWAVLGIALTAVAPVAVASLARNPVLAAGATVGGLACAGLVLAAAVAARRSRPLRAHAIALGASVVLSFNLLQFVLPRSDTLRTTTRLAELINKAPPGTPVGTVGYNEDSLTFATRARAEPLRPDAVDDWAIAHPQGVLVLPRDVVTPAGWESIGRIRGLNYSKGDPVDLTVFRPMPDAPAP